MSLSAYAHFNLTLSLGSSIVVNCNPLFAGVVLVGHCSDVLFFSVLRTIGTFIEPPPPKRQQPSPRQWKRAFSESRLHDDTHLRHTTLGRTLLDE